MNRAELLALAADRYLASFVLQAPEGAVWMTVTVRNFPRPQEYHFAAGWPGHMILVCSRPVSLDTSQVRGYPASRTR